MRERLRRHHISLKIAAGGLLWAFRTQPNFLVHIILSVSAIGLGIILGITRVELIIITFTVLLGLSAEMINTAIEAVTDLVSGGRWHEQAKIAKDVSAGMMLLVAIGAVVVAIFIFLPYFIRL